MPKYIAKKMLWAVLCVFAISLLIFALELIPYDDPACIDVAKPVIYLYPESVTDVDVQLDFAGQLVFTYPAYNGGWHVTAYPDGRLTDRSDGSEYGYLFWEGSANIDFDFSSGFVVAGCDTVAFLREKLTYMGLLPDEYNDFIVYWAPKMQPNEYNLISFQSDAYTDAATLDIQPAPDSMLRVFMALKPLDEPVTLPEQKLEMFKRTGFTVVEWGGAVIS